MGALVASRLATRLQVASRAVGVARRLGCPLAEMAGMRDAFRDAPTVASLCWPRRHPRHWWTGASINGQAARAAPGYAAAALQAALKSPRP